MRILVIGGSGHVSGALAKAALAQGHETWTVTRGQRPLPPGARHLALDRADTPAFDAALRSAGGVWDCVVDCIAYKAEAIAQDVALFRTRARHLIFISTDFVYAPAQRRFPQPAATDVYTGPGPGSLDYGFHKRQCELALRDADAGSMQWTVFRPCHIYGFPSQLGCLPLHGRDPHLIATLRAGKPVRLVGGGHFLQQPILSSDLAGLILSAAGREAAFGQVFNAAGPDIIESRRYYEIIAGVLGVPLQVEEEPVQSYLAANPDKAPFLCHRIYDLSRLRALSLQTPATPIEAGLRQHVEDLLAHART